MILNPLSASAEFTAIRFKILLAVKILLEIVFCYKQNLKNREFYYLI